MKFSNIRQLGQWQAIVVVALIMVTLFIKGTSTVEAKPAPPVTGVEIAEIWSDGSPEPVFPSLYFNEIPDKFVFKGTTLYIKTKFKGYPTWSLVFYRQGNVNGNLFSYEELNVRPIGSPVVTGWEQLVAIPFKQLGSYNAIAVSASSSSKAGVEYTAIVRNIRCQK